MRFAKTIAGLGIFVTLACLAQQPYHNSLAWRANQWVKPSATTPAGPFYILMDRRTNVLVSSDAITWWSNSVPITATWVSVRAGNGVFAAISADTTNGVVSVNATNWTLTRLNTGSAISLIDLAFGLGNFVAIAYGVDASVSSVNGSNWVSHTVGAANEWSELDFGGGRFGSVAHGNPGASDTVFSLDGTNWINGGTITINLRVYSVIRYGGGTWCCIENGGAAHAAASTDAGATWVEGTMPTTKAWVDAAYGNGIFVAIATDASYCSTSANGTNWVNQGNIVGATTGWMKIVFGGNQFVAVPQNQNFCATSPDGTNWTQRTLPVTSNWRALGYGP